jgi:hypothetical protein
MKAEYFTKFKAKKKYGKWELSGAPKTSTKKPSVAHDEVCVKMEISLPDILFEKPLISITGKIDLDISKDNCLSIATEAKNLIEKKLNITCEIKE